MKIVFLDIDGVCNHSRLYAELVPLHGTTKPSDWIDRECVARVNRICELTGAVILLSSSWRNYVPTPAYPGPIPVLRECGLTADVIGGTPAIEDMNTIVERNGTRWTEVRAWLDEHPEVTQWVALDDCDWRGFPVDHFVRTDMAVGLQDADVERAVNILTSTNPSAMNTISK